MPFIPPIPPKPESWTKSGSGIKPKNETTTSVLLPTMTTTQRDALTAVNGMVIYNSTTGTIQQYVSGAWGNFGGGGGSLTVEEIDGTPSVASVSKIKFTNGRVTDDGGGTVTVDLQSNIDMGLFTDNLTPTANTSIDMGAF